MASVAGLALDRVRREATRNGYSREVLPATPSSISTSAQQKKRNREPEIIGQVLADFYITKAVSKKLLLPAINEAWDQIVGSLVAQHTTPKALVDEVLQVSADSTVWAAQLTALGPVLVSRINSVTNSSTVVKIQVTGPKAKVPNYGPRTVKGRVGYRDTFG